MNATHRWFLAPRRHVAAVLVIAVGGILAALPAAAQVPPFAEPPSVQPGEHAQPSSGTEAPTQETASEMRRLMIVVGAEGKETFGARFREAAARWEQLARAEGLTVEVIGVQPADEATVAGSDRERLQAWTQSLSAENLEAWLVLIGHGTFDGRIARFNLRGPDVSAAELQEWLAPYAGRLIVVNCASASAPYINRLSGPDRVIVTATRSGSQYNATRFGDFVAAAIGDALNDLDKDGQVSILEAFVAASARTEEYYQTEQRLATEKALIDDNGDQAGTPADWFSGVRATRVPKESRDPDGRLANQVFLVRSAVESEWSPSRRAERDRLEAELEGLRRQREQLDEVEYLRRLEAILLPLSQLYEGAESAPSSANGGSPR